jgi:ligand-binding sensor domain-containing protein
MVSNSDIWYGAPSGIPTTQVFSILRDVRGTLLIGTQQRGLYMLSQGRIVPLPGAALLRHASVTCLCSDQDGGVWIGTAEMGLLYYDGSTVIPCMAPRGSSPLQVGSIMLDTQGNLWFGTHGDGLQRLRRSVVRYLRVVEPGVSSQIWGVTLSGEEIWIGTRGSGIRRFADGRIQKPPMPGKLSRMTVGALLPEPDGTLWIGGESGLYRMSEGKILEIFTPEGQSFNNPFGLLRDREGVIWIGGEGLFRMAGGKISRVAGLPSGITINFLLEDRKGDIWLATDANGVGRLTDGKFSSYSTDSGLTSNTILCLYEDGEGGIWAGTQVGGINRFGEGRWGSLTTSHGLLNNYVNTIIRADDGTIWMSTNQGLFGTSERSVIDAMEGRIPTVESVSIEARDGLRSTEFAGGLQSCSAKSRDGTLWFASVQGLVGYNPVTAVRTPSPPPVKIEAMEVDGKGIDIRSVTELGPGVRSIGFEFVGLSFVAPTATRYKYSLEGYDDAWVDGKSQRQASYAHLAPGAYVFRVTAANSDAVWNSSGAALRFTILPYFWQTAPFRILCVLVILGIVLGVYRLRVWQILAREKELQLRVDEAIAKIKVLHGLIPICANCKKIRDDKGFWNDLTKYLHEHSSAVLSHGICPDCMEELYGAELRGLKQKAKRSFPGKEPGPTVPDTGHA